MAEGTSFFNLANPELLMDTDNSSHWKFVAGVAAICVGRVVFLMYDEQQYKPKETVGPSLPPNYGAATK